MQHTIYVNMIYDNNSFYRMFLQCMYECVMKVTHREDVHRNNKIYVYIYIILECNTFILY